jgi:hypothetical protein
MAKKERICVYCQSARAVTKDHVPPKNLFRDEDKKKLQLVKVPACKACNNGNSANETRFRDVVAVMAGPSSAKEVYDAFRRSLDYEPSKRGRILADSYRNTKGRLVWKTENTPLIETVSKVAKGLHFIGLGRPWPLDARIDVYLDPGEKLQDLRESRETQHVSLGVPFSYSFVEEDDTSIWWLHFHNKLEAIVVFEAASALD